MLIFGAFRRKNKDSSSTAATSGHLDGAREKRGFGFAGTVVSDVGCVRPNNEDNYVLGKYMNVNSSDHSEISVSFSDVSGTWQFAGIFDGMGGGELGELASHDTAEIFLEAFSRLGVTPSGAEVDLCVRSAFLEANNRIVSLQKEHKIFGTTGTVLCADGVVFKIYHLGDSRAYLFRGGELMQLTKDQTLAQMKLEVGMYRQDDPGAEADRHKLTDYIGRDRSREHLSPVESQWIPIEAGDCVLLCSDGLYDMCTDGQISGILRGSGTIEEKTAALVRQANAAGGQDNITCNVVSFG